MKKILLVLLFAAVAQISIAQDFKKVKIAVGILKWEDAKTEIDKLANDPKAKDKPELYYYQSRIYAALQKNAFAKPEPKLGDPYLLAVVKGKEATDAAKSAGETNEEKLKSINDDAIAKSVNDQTEIHKQKVEKYRNEAIQFGTVAAAALEKYASMDAGFSKIKELGGVEPYFDMYGVYFQLGVNVFNEKSWLPAAQNFEKAIKYIDIIIQNKWAASPTLTMDTTALLYAGYAYQNANQMDDAAKFYSRLADSKVNEAIYLDLYRFLAQHFTKTNNEASFFKYLAIGKEIYPKEAWDEYEIDFIDTNYDLAKKTSLYDTEDAAGKLTEEKYLRFGDLFVNVKNKEKDLDSATQVKYTLKAAEAFQKAYQLNSANAAAIFNVGVIYYNIFGEYDDKVSTNIRTLRSISTANEEEFAAKKAAAKTPQAKAAVNKAAADKLAAAQASIKKQNQDIDVDIQKNIDLSVDALEKAFAALKDKSEKTKRDNNLLNNCVRYLTNLYEIKRNKFRGKDPQKYDMYEAKYKQYDALQNSFN